MRSVTRLRRLAESERSAGLLGKPEGRQVHRIIVSEYKEKGYAPEHAEAIAGAVAGEEHRGESMKKGAKRARKRRELKGSLVHKQARMVKGSAEAKAWAAKMRAAQGKKKVAFEKGSAARADRDKLAAKIARKGSAKEPYAVATDLVKKKRTRSDKGARHKKRR